MPPNQQTSKLFQLLVHRNFCQTVSLSPKSLKLPLSPSSPPSPESPDLPAWLVDKENPDFTEKNDDDFVIPSLADWVQNHNLGNSNPVANRLLFEPAISDIDKLSQILRKHQSSMDSLIEPLNGCGIDATNDLILQLLKRFNNDWASAFRVFTWAKNQTGYVHTPELYDIMVDILGKRQEFSLMWDLVEEMAKLKGYISSVTMTKVMRRLAAAGKYEDAIEVFRGLEKFGVSKDLVALNTLMDALAKERSVEHAMNVFMEFKDCISVNLHSFNILMHGYCKAGKLDEAKNTMVEMEKHGFQPGVVAYTCLIESYCKLKDFRNVDATLEEMEVKGCKPSVITYTIIMHNLGKAKQINEALEVYEKMKRNGLVPDAAFYSSLIFILSKSGRIKDAWNVFIDMEKQGVDRDVLTYNSMVSSACTHKQEENALKLLRLMEEKECKPNVETYGPLLKLCCKRKRIKVLKFLVDHMYKNNVSIDLGTYALLVRGLCNSGKIELACSFFEEAISKDMLPYDSTYKILVEALEKNNMAESMVKIQKLMVQMMKQQKPMPC
ncbi:pentatricopeptide repeat-containing protein At3g22670, mitochondrial-like [Euphorbia lathyris]|uniref:pentatricopeptide repeat-containing protein At3g22670, mitochondrial-like n=1 Tax=Euphorbia lathyris TaxID=212925 RepID=UPI0033137A69